MVKTLDNNEDLDAVILSGRHSGLERSSKTPPTVFIAEVSKTINENDKIPYNSYHINKRYKMNINKNIDKKI